MMYGYILYMSEIYFTTSCLGAEQVTTYVYVLSFTVQGILYVKTPYNLEKYSSS